jgi:peroxiredoxin
VRLREELEELGILPVFISADPPTTSAKLRARLCVPPAWPLLSDEAHRVADAYALPISRGQPKARSYPDGFIQPAVFVFAGEEALFSFVQRPAMLNLWGAARRPEPAQVLAAVRQALTAA